MPLILQQAALAVILLLPAESSEAVQQDQKQQGPSRQEELRKQREQRRSQLTPYETSEGEQRAKWWETNRLKAFSKGYHGIRPLIGGMDDPVLFGQVSSGAGFVGGIGYQNGLDRHEFRFRIDARYSTKGYQQLEGVAEFPTPRSDSPVQGFLTVGYRDFNQVNFFGIGSQSSIDNRSSFRLEDRRLRAGVKILPNRTFFLEAGFAVLNTHILSGEREPSFEEVFDINQIDDLQVFGIREPPDYHIYGGTFGLNFFDRRFPEVGAGLSVGVERYDDREEGLFDFTKITAELSGEVPLRYRNRRLAFRLKTVHHMADSGDDVPFYLLETIGGGTTLRGFRDYRFRDRRFLLMNLEYRWEVWTYADFALFADAGKVFRRAGDLDFSDLEASYGFGLLIRTPLEGRLGRYGRLRIDIANSHEGFRIHVGAGPDFGRRHPPRVH